MSTLEEIKVAAEEVLGEPVTVTLHNGGLKITLPDREITITQRRYMFDIPIELFKAQYLEPLL